MKCEICGKDILKDSQCIDYKYYHNDCIINLTKENKQLKDNWNKREQIIENERMSHWTPSPLFLTELLSKMQELEKILKEVE